MLLGIMLGFLALGNVSYRYARLPECAFTEPPRCSGISDCLHVTLSSMGLLSPAKPPAAFGRASARAWVHFAHSSSNKAEMYASSSIQQLVHSGHQQLNAMLAEAQALASSLALRPSQLQQLSSIAADTAAYTAALAARVADIVATPQPQQQQVLPNATVSWEQLAYTHAGASWRYTCQLVQPSLAQLTSTYTAQVQEMVSAAQEKGLPATDSFIHSLLHRCSSDQHRGCSCCPEHPGSKQQHPASPPAAVPAVQAPAAAARRTSAGLALGAACVRCQRPQWCF